MRPRATEHARETPHRPRAAQEQRPGSLWTWHNNGAGGGCTVQCCYSGLRRGAPHVYGCCHEGCVRTTVITPCPTAVPTSICIQDRKQGGDQFRLGAVLVGHTRHPKSPLYHLACMPVQSSALCGGPHIQDEGTLGGFVRGWGTEATGGGVPALPRGLRGGSHWGLATKPFTWPPSVATAVIRPMGPRPFTETCHCNATQELNLPPLWFQLALARGLAVPCLHINGKRVPHERKTGWLRQGGGKQFGKLCRRAGRIDAGSLPAALPLFLVWLPAA